MRAFFSTLYRSETDKNRARLFLRLWLGMAAAYYGAGLVSCGVETFTAVVRAFNHPTDLWLFYLQDVTWLVISTCSETM